MTQPNKSDTHNLMKTKSGWLPAIPLPYYAGFKKKCHCGKGFWRYESYQAHYVMRHVYGLTAPKYSRL